MRAALRAVLDAGFVFWGVFVVFAVVVVAYAAWMVWVERAEDPGGPRTGEPERGEGGGAR